MDVGPYLRGKLQKGEKYFGLTNLFDPDNTALNHHLDNALRANYIMLRDKDYVVQNDEHGVL